MLKQSFEHKQMYCTRLNPILRDYESIRRGISKDNHDKKEKYHGINFL